MAPRSQEPQVVAEDKKYIATISFTVDSKDKGTICYVYKGSRSLVSQLATEQFKKDFPIDGVGITINVAEIKDENLQKPTDKKKILKLIERYLDYQDGRGDSKKIKFNGEFKSINEIKEFYGFNKKQKATVKKEVKPVVQEKIEQETEPKVIIPTAVPQIPKKEKEAVPVKSVAKVWFCEYNIKIGTTRFRKGTKIDNADNEIDARKQLDVYIKRTFSKIRSITKVSIKEWAGEEEFSEEIVDKIAPVKQILAPKVKERTLDDIIKQEFDEEELNDRVIMVVVKHGKIKPKDFENDFFVKADEGQTDEELFQEFKKDCPALRKKHVATRRGTFKQVLTTNRYKQLLTSSAFKELLEEGKSGSEALEELLDRQIQKMKNGMVSDKLLDSLLDKLWTGLGA